MPEENKKKLKEYKKKTIVMLKNVLHNKLVSKGVLQIYIFSFVY